MRARAVGRLPRILNDVSGNATPMMLIRVLLVALLVYLAFVALIWLFQGRLLYLPDTGGAEIVSTPADIGLDYERATVTTGDGIELDGWFIPAADERATLLFFHGNAGNISHRLDSIRLFNELRLSVFIVDYRGYGRSGGQPSEQGTATDARAAWAWLIDNGRRPGEIIVHGRSLGAAVAAGLAREVQPGGVILESPFRSVPTIAQETYPFLPARWLTRFEYATEDHVREIHAPLLVVHSEDDEIIPFSHGRSVYEAANEPKTLLAIRGDHNTGFLLSGAHYRDGIDRFVARISRRDAAANR